MSSTRPFVRFTVLTSLVVGLIAVAAPSHAFRMIQNTSTGRVTAGAAVTCNDPGGFTHWSSSQISWYHNTSGQGSGKASALQSAMQSWTNVSGANHVLNYAGTTSSGWATDGKNTLLWTTGNGCNSGCLGLTALVLQSGQVIVESDIMFNANYTWNTNGADYDTEAVAAHELGHSLGIHHTEVSSTPRPTMYASYFGTGGRSLHADDQAALQCSENRYGSGGGGLPAPASLTIINEHCRGLNTVEWSSVSGATYYELYRSSNSSFSPQYLDYSGSATLRVVNVSSTTYYRVRACNASGCSAYRVGNTPATYFSGCL